MGTVNSKQQQLDAEGIIKEAYEGYGNKEISYELAHAILVKETNLPGTVLYVAGNTLFIIHSTKEEGTAIFRPINADIPENYMYNAVEFLESALKMKFKKLVSYPSKDETPLQLIEYAKRNGFLGSDKAISTQRTKDGIYVIITDTD